MEKNKKKALGSWKSIIEFYEDLYLEGIIKEGSSGYQRLMQLKTFRMKYGRNSQS